MDVRNVVRVFRGNHLAMFLLGATLALGFAWGAYLIASGLVRMKQINNLTVKGTAATMVTSDYATWSCSIACRAKDIAGGYHQLEAQRKQVMDFLKKSGIDAGQLCANPAAVEALYVIDSKGNDTNKVEGYKLEQSISVWSNDVKRIEKVSREITQLLQQGIELSMGQPEYTCTDIESIKLDLLSKAAKNAYERATIMASNTKGHVGRLQAAQQGVFQITPVNSTEVRGGGVYDTSTIQKSVRCVMTMDFEVER